MVLRESAKGDRRAHPTRHNRTHHIITRVVTTGRSADGLCGLITQCPTLLRASWGDQACSCAVNYRHTPSGSCSGSAHDWVVPPARAYPLVAACRRLFPPSYLDRHRRLSTRRPARSRTCRALLRYPNDGRVRVVG